ncbi:MAG: 4Fe-4S dicluster domain-containing protein [Bacillota bacterium]|nr:4Fe-4S dicluster domain-containing protein [Bacillota bacterium]
MKRVYVNEEWCLGCHLCEYNCSFANSGEKDMAKTFLMGRQSVPRITVEEGDGICFAVSCRHCDEPLCVKSCITGALSKKDGVICVDQSRCVGCFTCVLTCPFGAVVANEGKPISKCELCVSRGGEPACVSGCPNRAIEYKEG